MSPERPPTSTSGASSGHEVRQRLSDDRFVLTASRGGTSVTYDSSGPLGALLEPVRREVSENESGGGGA